MLALFVILTISIYFVNMQRKKLFLKWRRPRKGRLQEGVLKGSFEMWQYSMWKCHHKAKCQKTRQIARSRIYPSPSWTDGLCEHWYNKITERVYTVGGDKISRPDRNSNPRGSARHTSGGDAPSSRAVSSLGRLDIRGFNFSNCIAQNEAYPWYKHSVCCRRPKRTLFKSYYLLIFFLAVVFLSAVQL